MGGLTQFDKNAEKKIFKSANENKIIYCHSNYSRFSLTEMLKKKQSNYFCSSLYIDQDFNYIKKKIKELDDFHINTVVITIDSPIRSISYDKMNYNYDARKKMRKIPKDLIQDFKREKSDPLKWETIRKLRNITKKKIILKGILSCHDVEISRKIGVDGIWISNHGGRVLETDITSTEQLPEIKKIIKNKMTIICDGGVRTGTDFLKLLSLGADYVAIGRPIVYGLVFDKIKGVDNVLNLFCDELQSAAVLSGLKNLKEVDKLEKKINFNR